MSKRDLKKMPAKTAFAVLSLATVCVTQAQTVQEVQAMQARAQKQTAQAMKACDETYAPQGKTVTYTITSVGKQIHNDPDAVEPGDTVVIENGRATLSLKNTNHGAPVVGVSYGAVTTIHPASALSWDVKLNGTELTTIRFPADQCGKQITAQITGIRASRFRSPASDQGDITAMMAVR